MTPQPGSSSCVHRAHSQTASDALQRLHQVHVVAHDSLSVFAGLGFKAVAMIAQATYIDSGGFNFVFDTRPQSWPEDPEMRWLGLVCPSWVEDLSLKRTGLWTAWQVSLQGLWVDRAALNGMLGSLHRWQQADSWLVDILTYTSRVLDEGIVFCGQCHASDN